MISSLLGRDFPPAEGGRGNFKLLAQSQAEEDGFDFVKHRKLEKPNNVLESILNMVKGALGAGILSGHYAYMRAGLVPALTLNLLFAIYITYCLYSLGISAQILYKRCRVVKMSYPDVGEAAFSCHSSSKVTKWAKCFRYYIDFVICLDLFGSCATYQIIIAKTIKQLYEGSQNTSLEGAPGYPHLRVYLVAMIIPIIMMCLVLHMKWLAKFSLFGNVILILCIIMSIHYAFALNPHFENAVLFTTFFHLFEFTGMIIFSMSAAGVVVTIENNMKEPKKFSRVIITSMVFIYLGVFLNSFFGYMAFTSHCQTPMTMNFPLTTFPIILKGCVALMVYVTHGINFHVPFNLCYYYIKPMLPEGRPLMYELIFRAIFALFVSLIAIIFPTINALIGFLGAFCLSNMAFILPLVIEILVTSVRPGFGKMNWRLWRSLFFLLIGVVVMICGSGVNLKRLIVQMKF